MAQLTVSIQGNPCTRPRIPSLGAWGLRHLPFIFRTFPALLPKLSSQLSETPVWIVDSLALHIMSVLEFSLREFVQRPKCLLKDSLILTSLSRHFHQKASIPSTTESNRWRTTQQYLQENNRKSRNLCLLRMKNHSYFI